MGFINKERSVGCVLFLAVLPVMAFYYSSFEYSYETFHGEFLSLMDCKNHDSGHLWPDGSEHRPATPGMVSVFLKIVDFLQNCLATVGAIPAGILWFAVAFAVSEDTKRAWVCLLKAVGLVAGVIVSLTVPFWIIAFACLYQARFFFWFSNNGWVNKGFTRLMANTVGLLFVLAVLALCLWLWALLLRALAGAGGGGGNPPQVIRGTPVGNITTVNQTMIYVRNERLK